MTQEPGLFKRMFQCNIEDQYENTLDTFPVPIGIAKEIG